MASATAASAADAINMKTYWRAKKAERVSADPSGEYICVMTS